MMLAVSREDRARIEAGEKVDLGSQFWFAAAGELETEHVGSYKDARALVLPAINTFRYTSHGHRQIAEEDIVRLSRAGVHTDSRSTRCPGSCPAARLLSRLQPIFRPILRLETQLLAGVAEIHPAKAVVRHTVEDVEPQILGCVNARPDQAGNVTLAAPDIL